MFNKNYNTKTRLSQVLFGIDRKKHFRYRSKETAKQKVHVRQTNQYCFGIDGVQGRESSLPAIEARLLRLFTTVGQLTPPRQHHQTKVYPYL